MTDKINEFIISFDDEKREIIINLRELATSLAKGATEGIKWNALCLFKGERAFVGIMPYKKYVSVIFDRGAELTDSKSVLEGNGKQMRHIKIHQISDIKNKDIACYIKASYSLK